MKKILLLALSLVLIVSMAIGFSGCKKDKGGDVKSYTLDTSSFNSLAVYGESLS